MLVLVRILQRNRTNRRSRCSFIERSWLWESEGWSRGARKEEEGVRGPCAPHLPGFFPAGVPELWSGLSGSRNRHVARPEWTFRCWQGDRRRAVGCTCDVLRGEVGLRQNTFEGAFWRKLFCLCFHQVQTIQ